MARTKVKKIIDGDTFKGSYNKFFRLAGVEALLLRQIKNRERSFGDSRILSKKGLEIFNS